MGRMKTIEANSKKDFDGLGWGVILHQYIPFTFAYGNKNHSTDLIIEVEEKIEEIDITIYYKGVEHNPWLYRETQEIGGGLNRAIEMQRERNFINKENHRYIDGINIIKYTHNLKEMSDRTGTRFKNIEYIGSLNKFKIKTKLNKYDQIYEFNYRDIMNNIRSKAKTKTNEGDSYIGNCVILAEFIFNIGLYSMEVEKLKYNIYKDKIICTPNIIIDTNMFKRFKEDKDFNYSIENIELINNKLIIRR